jgi:hypothetical protein
MCPRAKNPICPRKLLQDPIWSPRVENSKAIVICQGHSHSEAKVRTETQYVILCGYSNGRKNRMVAHRYNPVAARAIAAVCFSSILKIAIKHSFSANIANFPSLCQKILSSLHAWFIMP